MQDQPQSDAGADKQIVLFRKEPRPAKKADYSHQLALLDAWTRQAPKRIAQKNRGRVGVMMTPPTPAKAWPTQTMPRAEQHPIEQDLRERQSAMNRQRRQYGAEPNAERIVSSDNTPRRSHASNRWMIQIRHSWRQRQKRSRPHHQ